MEPVLPSIDVNLPLALDVKVFNEPVEVSIAFTLVKALEVNVLKSLLIDELADSSEVNLPLALDVNVFKEPVLVSIADTLVNALEVKVLILLVAVCKVPITVLFEPV
jgi:hypothetical protein